MLISLSAIRISDYKKWGAKFNKDLYKSIFQRYTKKKNAYRIYLPIGEHYTESHTRPLPEVVKALDDLGYIIEDYTTGLAIKADKSKKNPVRIGKLLNNQPELLKKYAEHKHSLGIKGSSELVVVISRHPYDIMGMSTDRGWTSCTDLALPPVQYEGKERSRKQIGPGINAHYVITDVAAGNIIAYLVDKTDLNVRRPKARMRILAYVNKDTQDFVLKAHDVVYGTDTPLFRKTVDKWLGEVNEVNTDGMYCAIDNMDEQDGAENLYVVKSSQQILDLLQSKMNYEKVQQAEALFSTDVNSKHITKAVIDLLIARVNSDTDFLSRALRLAIPEAILEYAYDNVAEQDRDDISSEIVANKNCSYTLLKRIVSDLDNDAHALRNNSFFNAVVDHPETDDALLRTLILKYEGGLHPQKLDIALSSRKLSEASIREFLTGYSAILAANENTPLVILREMLDNPNVRPSVKEDIIENPALPRELVRKYALQSGDKDLLKAAASNPNINAEDLSLILQDGTLLAKLRVFDHPKVQTPHVVIGLADESSKVQLAAARSSAMTPALVDKILDGKSKTLKIAALHSGQASVQDITKALGDSSLDVINAAIESSVAGLTDEHLLILAKHTNSQVRLLALQNSDKPPAEVLDLLVLDKDKKVQREAAEKPNLSAANISAIISQGSLVALKALLYNTDAPLTPAHFETLSASPFEGIRTLIAGNDRTPLNVLKALLSDPEPAVRSEAADNPLTSPADLTSMLAKETDVSVLRIILSSSALPAAAWKAGVQKTVDEIGAYGKEAIEYSNGSTEEDERVDALLSVINDAFSNTGISTALQIQFLKNARSPNVIASILRNTRRSTDGMLLAVLNNPNIDLRSTGLDSASSIISNRFVSEMQKVAKPATLTRVLQETSVQIKSHVPVAKYATKEHISAVIELIDPAVMAAGGYAEDGDSILAVYVYGILNSRVFAQEHVAPLIARYAVDAEFLDTLEDAAKDAGDNAAKLFALYYMTTPPLFLTQHNELFRVYHGLEPVPPKMEAAFYGNAKLSARDRKKDVKQKRMEVMRKRANARARPR
jgi:hypothetical protein